MTTRSIEPLSMARYKVAFTADAELKRKLELARDLLRHAVPHGDLADVVARAIDLLLEQLMKRRFAVRPERKPDARAPTPPPHAPSEAVPLDPTVPATADAPAAQAIPTTTDATPDPTRSAAARHRYVPSEVRRAVFARDGARCAWRGPDGVRCNSHAWLELDHVTPFGCGGDHHPDNIRLFCRAHNRLAAEQAYGQGTISRCIARRRARREHRAVADPRLAPTRADPLAPKSGASGARQGPP